MRDGKGARGAPLAGQPRQTGWGGGCVFVCEWAKEVGDTTEATRIREIRDRGRDRDVIGYVIGDVIGL